MGQKLNKLCVKSPLFYEQLIRPFKGRNTIVFLNWLFVFLKLFNCKCCLIVCSISSSCSEIGEINAINCSSDSSEGRNLIEDNRIFYVINNNVLCLLDCPVSGLAEHPSPWIMKQSGLETSLQTQKSFKNKKKIMVFFAWKKINVCQPPVNM